MAFNSWSQSCTVELRKPEWLLPPHSASLSGALSVVGTIPFAPPLTASRCDHGVCHNRHAMVAQTRPSSNSATRSTVSARRCTVLCVYLCNSVRTQVFAVNRELGLQRRSSTWSIVGVKRRRAIAMRKQQSVASLNLMLFYIDLIDCWQHATQIVDCCLNKWILLFIHNFGK